MTRIGITSLPRRDYITGDGKRLGASKPAPDPSLLAASDLGYTVQRSIVFEDSSSGIEADAQ